MPLNPFEPTALVAARALVGLLQIPTASAGGLDRRYQSLGALVASVGSMQSAVEALRAGRVDWLIDVGLFTAAHIDEALHSAARDIAGWEAAGLSATAFGEADYPAQLEQIADAPPILFWQGSHSAIEGPGVAVVGTRKASSEGERRAERAVRALVEKDLVIFSGLAIGIDAAAHRAALKAGGRTVAVMGTPITRRYPAAHRGLADDIVASGGSLVSEYLPSKVTAPWDFLRRNKTMSGLALVTLVIEAGATSGAKSQAEAALKHGRSVFLAESLVRAHRWAANLVEEGLNGVRPLVLRDPAELADILAGRIEESSSAISL